MSRENFINYNRTGTFEEFVKRGQINKIRPDIKTGKILIFKYLNYT